jgi:dipeptidyl aminopeptidase/acylaminoacyl peptidase
MTRLASFLVLVLLSVSLGAETPAGLLTLRDDSVLSSHERDWTRLGIRTWELRDLNRDFRDSEIEAWNVAYQSLELGIMGYVARPHIRYNKLTQKPEETFPALILCHGSGRGVTQPYREIAKEFARRGYVVAASSYRGNRGSEGKSQGVRQFAKTEVIDVLQLAQLVRKLDYVDSMRLAILGQGEGGSIAAQMIGRSNIFQAAVVVSPFLFSGFPEFGYAGMNRLRSMSSELFGRQLSDSELLRELRARDAFRFAEKIQSPVLIIAPEPDPGEEELRQWIELLQRKNVEHRVMRYPGMFPDFMTAIDNGTRPPGWRAQQANAWLNVSTWIEHYAPANGARELDSEAATQ